MRGMTIALYVNGVAVVSATDNRYAAAGRAGLRLGIESGNVPVTNSTGLHLDNFRLVPSTGTAVVDAKGGNVGTFSGSPLLNVPGALAGDYNTSVQWGTSNG